MRKIILSGILIATTCLMGCGSDKEVVCIPPVEVTPPVEVVPPVESSVIYLTFDDWSDTWGDMLDMYRDEDMQFTFYISQTGGFFNDLSNTAIIFEKMKIGGHSIGSHTQTHKNLKDVQGKELRNETELNEITSYNVLLEDILQQPVTLFAYPFGAFDSDWDVRLGSHFSQLRRFGTSNNEPPIYDDVDLSHVDNISSASVDNAYFNSDQEFYEYVDALSIVLQGGGKSTVLTSHSMSDDTWGITPHRLEYLLRVMSDNGHVFRAL